MRKLKYHRVDVFTDRAFGGNPLAVFVNGRGIDSETMQAIAKEFNLSETTFVLPPDNPEHNYRVRIFTPARELPMAGHPTIGTSFVLGLEKMIDATRDETAIILEEGVGPIPVRVEFRGSRPTYAEMTQPLPKFGPVIDDRASVAAMLSLSETDLVADLPVEVVSCGVPFLFVPLRDLEAARKAQPLAELIERTVGSIAPPEVFVFCRQVIQEGSTVHSRMFAPTFGIVEDPATGGASGPLGSYLVKHGVVKRSERTVIVSEQGIEMGRPSFIRITIESEGDSIRGVKVGGETHYMGEGYIEVGC